MTSNPERSVDEELDRLLSEIELLAGSEFYDFETRQEAAKLIKSHTQQMVLEARIAQARNDYDFILHNGKDQATSYIQREIRDLESQLKSKEETKQ